MKVVNQCKSKTWALVINLPESRSVESVTSVIVHLAKLAQYRFAYIVHDSDIKEDGSPKTLHIHCVIWDTLTTSKKAFLAFIGNNLDLPSECITLAPCYREKMTISYFVHMYNPDKFQYSRDSIVSNCMERVVSLLDISPVCDDTKAVLSEKEILRLIKSGITFSDLIKRIGIVNANVWRHAYSIIRTDLETGRDSLD